jgi:hypothetical protein
MFNFDEIQLGDIVVLPDGRGLTTRAKVELPGSVGSMAGFVIAGEMEVLLSNPPSSASPVNVYVPINYFPFDQATCREAYRGVTRYWAPHLPALGGAMSEIRYRVVEVPGSVDPVVLVYRGQELIVFIRSSMAWSKDVNILHMDRPQNNEAHITRYSSTVDQPAPVPMPTPVEVPEREYAYR